MTGSPSETQRRTTDAPPSKSTASAGRERRCIVARAVMPEARLVRFALAPDGVVTPDVGAKLPGRGAWVEATRAAVDKAARKNLFAGAFQRGVRPPADLADQVEHLLEQRCLAQLGLCRRAGALAVGFQQVRDMLKGEKPAWLILAHDGAPDGRTKMSRLARAAHGRVPIAGCFSAADMGKELGRGVTAHACLREGEAAARWTRELNRLCGFRAIAPQNWDVFD